MRGLIFRYLFGELAGALVSGILIFSGILLVNIFFKAADLLLSSGIHPGHLLDLVLSLIPHLLTMTTPMSLLLAFLLVYGRLAEHGEVLALTASGVGYRKIFGPGITLAALLTLFMLFMENTIAPRANDLERQAKLDIIRDSTVVGLEEGVFNDTFPGYVIYIRRIDREAEFPLQGIVIHLMEEPEQALPKSDRQIDPRIAPRNELQMIILSRYGSVEIDPEFHFLTLSLQGGTAHVIGGFTHTIGTFTHATLALNIQKMVEKMSRGEARMKAFSTRELAEEARRLEQARPRDPELRERNVRDIRRLWREFYFRQSIPATCFAIPWLAIPLGIWTRSGRKSLAFGVSLVAFFGYYLLLALGKALIKDGVVAPWLGCWMPVMVLLGIGLFFTYRVTRS